MLMSLPLMNLDILKPPKAKSNLKCVLSIAKFHQELKLRRMPKAIFNVKEELRLEAAWKGKIKIHSEPQFIVH